MSHASRACRLTADKSEIDDHDEPDPGSPPGRRDGTGVGRRERDRPLGSGPARRVRVDRTTRRMPCRIIVIIDRDPCRMPRAVRPCVRPTGQAGTLSDSVSSGRALPLLGRACPSPRMGRRSRDSPQLGRLFVSLDGSSKPAHTYLRVDVWRARAGSSKLSGRLASFSSGPTPSARKGDVGSRGGSGTPWGMTAGLKRVAVCGRAQQQGWWAWRVRACSALFVRGLGVGVRVALKAVDLL